MLNKNKTQVFKIKINKSVLLSIYNLIFQGKLTFSVKEKLLEKEGIISFFLQSYKSKVFVG